MPCDELLRRDGLGLVPAADEHVEMLVTGDDEVGVRGDGAVGEFVVVSVCGDGAEEKGGRDVKEAATSERANGGHGAHGLRRVSGGTKASHDLFVFKKNIGGDRPGKAAHGPSAEDEMIPVAGLEHGQRDVGVDHDNHRP